MILQLLRNKDVAINKSTALSKLKTLLAGRNVGEVAIGIYESKNVLLGISAGGGNYQIFEGSKLDSSGNLLIPDSVKNEITKILGGATEEYNSLGKLEGFIKKLQGELDATQKGAGLGENGVYIANGNTNYINAATSLKDADEKLDAKLKDLEGKVLASEQNITKNKVVAGNGISVNTNTENTEVSIKLDAQDNVLTTSPSGLLANLKLNYVKKSGIETPKLELIGKNGTKISTIDVTDFIVDGMLDKAELVGDELVLTFNSDSKKDVIRVDLKKYITLYTGGNGISIEGNKVSAKIKQGEKVLVSSAEGLSINDTEFKTKVGETTYKSALPKNLGTPKPHGGLPQGTTVEVLEGKTFSQLFDDILFEEIEPNVVAPSASLTLKNGFSNNAIYEVGAAAPSDDARDFTVGFSQGSITVVGQPSKHRAGAKGGHTITLGSSQLNASQKITLGSMTYNVSVSYAQGDVALTSKGNKSTKISPNPLPSGSISASCTIHGTYPYFCNGLDASASSGDKNFPSSVTQNTKLPLKTWNTTQIGAKFASESSTGVRAKFYFPSLKNITKVEFFNTVSNAWEVFGQSNWTVADAGNKVIQGNNVAYKEFTTTSAYQGAIQYRFTLANVSRAMDFVDETVMDERIEPFGLMSAETHEEPIMMAAASTGNRAAGVAAFAVNFEPGGQAPLDARLLVKTKADLTNAATYSAKNAYNGMTVTVLDDGGKPNIYILKDAGNITSEASWIKQSPETVELTLKGYSRSTLEGTQLQLTATDTVVGAFGKMEKAVVDNEHTCAVAFKEIKDSVGLSQNLKYVAPSGNYISGATSVKNADELLDAQLKSSTDRIGILETKKINGHLLTSNPTLDGSDIKLDGYSKGSEKSNVVATDTVNGAIAKLENQIDGITFNGSNAIKVDSSSKTISLIVDPSEGNVLKNSIKSTGLYLSEIFDMGEY